MEMGVKRDKSNCVKAIIGYYIGVYQSVLEYTKTYQGIRENIDVYQGYPRKYTR